MRYAFLHLTLWLLLCIAALAGYKYWYTLIADKSTTVADLQNQIDTKAEASDRTSSARTILAEIAGDESVVQSYFVPETSIVSFIGDLEARARAQAATMKVTSVSTGGTAARPTLVLSLTLDGTFDATMRTLGAIEYAPYDISISKLSLAQSGKNIWHADLGLVVGSVPATAATAAP